MVINEAKGETGAAKQDLSPGCLQSEFLNRCEAHVAELRVKKSELLTNSRQCQQEIARLVQSMHLNTTEVLSIVVDHMRRSVAGCPDWWNLESAKQIVQETIQSKFMVTPDVTSDMYLSTVCGVLTECASARSKVSEKLKSIVENAQRTLLDIAGRELDAREAYAGFHDALFRLPPISKDLILSCISELEALIEGIEAMTGSETEALTVVWEALKTPADERSDFWGAVEKSSSLWKKETTGDSFLTLEHQTAVSQSREEWMIHAVRRASEVEKELDMKLSKLREIHNEVERLRTRQEAKSQILSLDAEIRMMNAKLADFEDFQCDKSRLLSKKNGGSALLKEERFRKQMQSKFASYLEQLGMLLREWEQRESTPFDASVLSEDVRELAMQHEPIKMEEVVENRTKLMSLRTVKKTQSHSPGRTKNNKDAAAGLRTSTSRAGRQGVLSVEGRGEKKGQKNKYESGLTPSRKRRAISSQKDPFGLGREQSEQPKALYLTNTNQESRPVSVSAPQRPPKLSLRQEKNANISEPEKKTNGTNASSHPLKRSRKIGSAPIAPFGRILDDLDYRTNEKPDMGEQHSS
jgi:hypothetical protein